ncbi:hypothetical protein [Sphingopyxis sp. OAS728]|nr:hypothetical protein [Sphingopyxis sp. OAS728]
MPGHLHPDGLKSRLEQKQFSIGGASVAGTFDIAGSSPCQP